MTKYILSVDGGGIRGIIPAIILAEIERKTKKSISEIFDFMAGSSTGAIVVAGLCKSNYQKKPQYSANDLIELYREYGSYIFKSSFLRKSIFSWFCCSEYSCQNLEFVLDKYFGDETLQNTLNNLLITSYDVHNDIPFFFKSWKEDKKFFKLKDALRASTAAPTYFVPKRLEVNKKKRVLVDGGVFANNPAACAYAAVKSLFPKNDIVLLSIGTGRRDTSMRYANSHRFGKIQWIKKILNITFRGSLDAVNYQLDKVMGDKYIRIQSDLKIASPAMDNTTSKNIEDLQKEAKEMIKANQIVIDNFCAAITK